MDHVAPYPWQLALRQRLVKVKARRRRKRARPPRQPEYLYFVSFWVTMVVVMMMVGAAFGYPIAWWRIVVYPSIYIAGHVLASLMTGTYR